MRKSRVVSAISTLGLVAAFFIPALPAGSAENVTKTVTVTDSNGDPYAGVTVAMMSYDDATQSNVIREGHSSVTNSSGVAVVTVPDVPESGAFQGLAIQTSASDNTHAMQFLFPDFLATNETRSAQLLAADTVVEVTTSEGAQTPAGTSVIIYDKNGDFAYYVSSTRPGPIALALAGLDPTLQPFDLQVNSSPLKDTYAKSYTLEIVDGAPVIFDGDQELTAVGGVIELKLQAPNISGQLTLDGNNYSLPSGVEARVMFSKMVNGNLRPATGVANNNGSFDTLIDEGPGEYQAVVHFDGAGAPPSQAAGMLYVNANGEYSIDNVSFEDSSTFIFDLAISTVSNFSAETPGGYAAYIDVFDFEGAPGFFGPNWSATGIASWFLPDGNYELFVTPSNRSYRQMHYQVSVASGVPTVTDFGNLVTPESGTHYVLGSEAPNLTLRVLDPNTASPLRNTQVTLHEGDNYLGHFNDFMGNVGVFVPGAGTYSLRVQAEGVAAVETVYTLTATDSGDSLSFAITDASDTPVVASGGVFELALDLANVVFTVLDSNGDPYDGGDFVRLEGELQIRDGSYWNQVSWLQSQGNQVFARVDDVNADYRVVISPSGAGDPNHAFVIREFTIEAAQLSGTQLELTVQLPAPMLRYQVLWEDRLVSNIGGSLRYPDDTEHNVSIWDDGAPAGLAFTAPGNYELSVDPNDRFEGASRTVFAITVSEVEGVLQATIPGETETEGVYQLALAAGNLQVYPVDPTDDSFFGRDEANVRVYTEGPDGSRVHITDGRSNANGLVSINVDPGTYVLEVDHQSDNYLLVARKLDLVIADDETITITDPANGDAEIVAESDGSFLLALDTANVYGRAMIDGTTPLATNWQQREWADVSLRKKNAFGEFQWINKATQTNSQGYFAFNITEAGEYKVYIEPQGFEGVAKTESDPFIVTEAALATLDQNLGNITMVAPGFYVRAINPLTDSVVTRAGVEIRTEDRWIDWIDTGSSGKAGVAISEAGDYILVVHPSGDGSSPGTTRRTYELSVTGDPGSFTYTIAGETAVDGVYDLDLGVPSLTGVVYDPTGSSTVRDAQVIPIDTVSGESLWEYSAQSNFLGQWNMALPEGSYQVYARAPWGSATLGDGPKSSTFTVDANGIATVAAGLDATAFDLSLSLPTWSGTVVVPGTTDVLPGTQICLVVGTNQQWYCVDANNDGEWAMSAPEGFTGFDSSSRLHVREWRTGNYAEKRIEGEALEALFGVYVEGNTYENITLEPASPNFEVRVTAGGVPVPRVWVNVDRPNFGWLGGGETNADGVAKIYLDDPWQEINVQVNVENNPSFSQNYATTRVELASDAGSGVRTVSIPLNEPNFQGFVETPDGSAVRYSWVDAQDQDTYEWIGGSSTDRQGRFALRLPEPDSGDKTYLVNVNPSWSDSGTWSRKSYLVTVTDGSGITDVTARGGAEVIADIDGNYTLTLASPSVQGVVIDSEGNPVRDSWVVPLDNTLQAMPDYLHDYSSNSRANGGFSMALPNGEYLLEANPPWNSNGDARSARCDITIGSGAITAGDANCWTAGSGVTLTLRAPNVRFTLTDGTDPVPFANVGIGYGSWHTWVQADRNGDVALFIDAQEIATLNPELNSSDTVAVRFWFDPPYGNSDIVRWECEAGESKPVCQDIPLIDMSDVAGYLSTSLNLGDIAFPEPNTRVRVLAPDETPVGAGAWVGLMVDPISDSCDGCRIWLGGGQTDDEGYAAFSVDDQYLTAGNKFYLDVNAPWNQRQTYAPVQYEGVNNGGLTYAEVKDQSFKLATPNLTITLLQNGNGKAAKWSWIGVEEVDASDNYSFVDWVGGSGVDNRGLATVSLEGSKTFRLTAHPGPASVGVRTTCLVETTSDRTVGIVTGECALGVLSGGGNLELALSAGNVSGTVTYDDAGTPTAVAGAIVYAEAAGQESVSTVTNSNGGYSLQLEEGIAWTMKVFVVSRAGDPVQLVSNTNAATLTPTGTPTQDLVVLTAAQAAE